MDSIFHRLAYIMAVFSLGGKLVTTILNEVARRHIDASFPWKMHYRKNKIPNSYLRAMKDLLKDLKVIEFASVLAGPAVGMFLAELGADVVKIENKTTGGDVTRSWKLPEEDPHDPISAYFCSVNYGKKYELLDFNNPTDLAHAQAMAQEADVVISNFKPSAAQRFQLDAETLRGKNTRLIYAQVSAFADPADESPAFDMVLQAEAGFLYMCGEPNRPPVKMPVALIDIIAAHQLKEGILLALLHRERSGEGCTVSTSLIESALASLANQATNYLMAGHVPQPMGSLHPNIAPYGEIFNCADQQLLVLAVGTERQFQHLCQAINMPELVFSEQYRTNADRVRNRTQLQQLLEAAFAQENLDTWMQRLKALAVPAARIRDMKAVMQRPEISKMLLYDNISGKNTTRMRSIAFTLQP